MIKESISPTGGKLPSTDVFIVEDLYAPDQTFVVRASSPEQAVFKLWEKHTRDSPSIFEEDFYPLDEYKKIYTPKAVLVTDNIHTISQGLGHARTR